MPYPTVSVAHVKTERPGRYAKQLASHMKKKIDTGYDAETSNGFLEFPNRGYCQLTAQTDTLVLRLEALAEEQAHLEHVIGIHLARFGVADQIKVSWERADGTAGDSCGPLTKEEVIAHRRAKEARMAAASA
ncbi:hypothetical protein BSR28_03005 [Boudabousia liubingyangii]|uniref:DUF2218 domain-containing protein n=1 Tax=Boudabousia liubingyangii TaxID=1921764 RepID=UPI00093EACA4|nr:DUF2218 domain-containing protein [Boudabousia liubingyangii]OKL47486.1 hypothetical protein BSR28_03005 [Boudabousia liubingyangii]